MIMEPDEQNLALSQGLLGLGAGLLSGSFGHYGAFAPALGQGASGFQQGYNGYINSSVQNKLYRAHTAKFLADVDRENRMAGAAAQIGGILSGQQGQSPVLGAPNMNLVPALGPVGIPNITGNSPQSAVPPPGTSPLVNPVPQQPPIQGTPLAPPAPQLPPKQSDQFLKAYQIAAANGLPGAETYYKNYQDAQKQEQYKQAFNDAYESVSKRYPGTQSTEPGGATVLTSGPDPSTKSEFWRQLSTNLRDMPGMADSAKEAMTRAIELDNQERQQANQDRQQSKQDISTENSLRDDYNKISKNFADVRDGYQRIIESAKNPSAAGDLSLIFSYMKILDPTSVVREGEQASAANARGVPEAVRSWYNRVVSGEKLTDAQRADFVDRGGMLYNAALENQKATETQYREIAKRHMINPDNVVLPLRVKDSREKYGL